MARSSARLPAARPASPTPQPPRRTYLYTIAASYAAANPSAPSSGAGATTPAAIPPADTAKPSTPSALTAASAPGEIDLTWSASTDNTALAGYAIARDGTRIGTSYSATYADTGLQPGSTHTYSVTALDGSGNASDPRSGAAATAGPTPPASSTYTYDLADRLTAIATASGSTTAFSIDAAGRHASQTIGTNPTSTYSYLGATTRSCDGRGEKTEAGSLAGAAARNRGLGGRR